MHELRRLVSSIGGSDAAPGSAEATIVRVDRQLYLRSVSEAVRGCTREFCAALPYRVTRLIAPDLVDRCRGGQGETVQRLIHLPDPAAPVVQALPATEARIQPVDSAALPIVMVDRRMAIVSLNTVRPERSAVLVRGSDTLDELTRTFERMWAASHPLPDGDSGPRDRREAIMAGLSRGLTDAAIAAALRIGERTVRREIQALMATTGARSRFQLGMHLALRHHRNRRAVKGGSR